MRTYFHRQPSYFSGVTNGHFTGNGRRSFAGYSVGTYDAWCIPHIQNTEHCRYDGRRKLCGRRSSNSRPYFLRNESGSFTSIRFYYGNFNWSCYRIYEYKTKNQHPACKYPYADSVVFYKYPHYGKIKHPSSYPAGLRRRKANFFSKSEIFLFRCFKSECKHKNDYDFNF